MAITYVGSASAASNSVSLPTFQAGDLALASGIATGSVTIPSGWTLVPNQNAISYGQLAYRVLQPGDTSTGTWTNATSVGVVVYRGVHQLQPFDWILSYGAMESATATFYALTPPTSGALVVGILHTRTEVGADSVSTTSLSNRTSGLSLQYFGVADGSSVAGTENYSLSGTDSWRRNTIALRPASDFPIVADQDTTSGTVTSNSSSWTLTYPTNIAAGDLLVGILAADGISGYVSSITDWVVAYHTDPLGDFTANAISYFKKLATGSETGTFNVTLAASEQGSWIIYRIPVRTWHGAIGTNFSNGYSSGSLEVISSYIGSPSSTPDPMTLSPINWDLENTLWLAAASVDTSRTVSAYPSSPDTFTNTGYLASGGSGGATLAWGRLEKSAQTVDPGTFTISSSDEWVATTIAIRPAAKSLPPSRPLRHPLIYR